LLLIDVAIPDELNVKTTETKKLRKYLDLEIEVSRMWKVRTKIVPVIIGDFGTIKKGLDQNLLLCPGQPPVGRRTTQCHANQHIIRTVLG
jgi:hypothetical protein